MDRSPPHQSTELSPRMQLPRRPAARQAERSLVTTLVAARRARDTSPSRGVATPAPSRASEAPAVFRSSGEGQPLWEHGWQVQLQGRAGRMAGMPSAAMMRASSSCGVQACSGVGA